MVRRCPPPVTLRARRRADRPTAGTALRSTPRERAGTWRSSFRRRRMRTIVPFGAPGSCATNGMKGAPELAGRWSSSASTGSRPSGRICTRATLGSTAPKTTSLPNRTAEFATMSEGVGDLRVAETRAPRSAPEGRSSIRSMRRSSDRTSTASTTFRPPRGSGSAHRPAVAVRCRSGRHLRRTARTRTPRSEGASSSSVGPQRRLGCHRDRKDWVDPARGELRARNPFLRSPVGAVAAMPETTRRRRTRW